MKASEPPAPGTEVLLEDTVRGTFVGVADSGNWIIKFGRNFGTGIYPPYSVSLVNPAEWRGVRRITEPARDYCS